MSEYVIKVAVAATIRGEPALKIKERTIFAERQKPSEVIKEALENNRMVAFVECFYVLREEGSYRHVRQWRFDAD